MNLSCAHSVLVCSRSSVVGRRTLDVHPPPGQQSRQLQFPCEFARMARIMSWVRSKQFISRIEAWEDNQPNICSARKASILKLDCSIPLTNCPPAYLSQMIHQSHRGGHRWNILQSCSWPWQSIETRFAKPFLNKLRYIWTCTITCTRTKAARAARAYWPARTGQEVPQRRWTMA